jgi:ferredoxin
MRIEADFDRCSSSAVCAGIYPEVFEVRDDNLLYVLDESPPEESRSLLELAIRACPTQALSIVED